MARPFFAPDKSGLQCDLYQLVQSAVYHADGLWGEVCFDLSLTGLPEKCAFAVVAGVQEALDEVVRLRFSDEEIRWLAMRAEGGFGIVTTAAANVSEQGKGWDGEFGVWSDHHLPGLTQLAAQITKYESIGLVQLFQDQMKYLLYCHVFVSSFSSQYFVWY